MLHPQAAAAAELWAADATALGDIDVAAQRAAARAEGLAAPKVEVRSVVDVDAGGVDCRLYRPAEGAPLVVHLHGGGFVFGDLETHDAHSRRLTLASGWAVLSVDYRRAPEHTYPAASDDVDTVVDWLLTHGRSLGVDTGRLSILGDSSGGQLALVTALRRPVFASLALVYPCIDPALRYPSVQTESGGLDATEMSWYWASYLGSDGVAGRRELATLISDLSGLPRTLVITAEHDRFATREALAAQIAAAGVSCVATRYLGMIHGFFRHPDLFDASAVAMAQVAAWLGSTPTT